MAYVKTVWESREGENLEKFTKLNETAFSVILINTPDSITRAGTPLSPENMNKIEQGIYDAHQLIATESLARQELEGYVQVLREMVESILGPVNRTYQLATEDGDYLVTEDSDYLVVA